LGVSTRTIGRRIRAGELPSRLTDTGVREVLADTTPTDDANHADTLAVVQDQAERGLRAAGAALTIAGRLADDRQDDLKAARRGARLGWAIVGILTAIGAVALWWATGTITNQQGMLALAAGNTDHLAARLVEREIHLADVGARADSLAEKLTAAEADREALRADLITRANELVTATQAAVAVKVDLAAIGAELQTIRANLERARADLAGRPTSRPSDTTAAAESDESSEDLWTVFPRERTKGRGRAKTPSGALADRWPRPVFYRPKATKGGGRGGTSPTSWSSSASTTDSVKHASLRER